MYGMGPLKWRSLSCSRYVCHQKQDLIIEDHLQRLGKNPEDYPDAKTQPHVQVALRMKARGASPRAGDVIPYIFCIGPAGETSKTANADRAKHPEEVRKPEHGFKIGMHVHPNSTRLTGTPHRLRILPGPTSASSY